MQISLIHLRFSGASLYKSGVVNRTKPNLFLCIWQYFTWVSCLITTEFAYMIRTWSLQKFPKLTNKWSSASNLYVWHWQSKLFDIPPTVDRYFNDNQRSTYRPSVRITAGSRSLRRPSLGPYLGRYISRYVDRHIGQASVDMSTDTSVTCRSIFRPIYRSRAAQNTHDPKNNQLNYGRCVIYSQCQRKAVCSCKFKEPLQNCVC